MAAPVDNTATLKSLVSVANSKIEPKILTDRNFKVLSIKPLRSTTSPHNTVASVQVDLAGDSPIAIVSSDRYSRRLVEFTRIDLKDIANFRAIPKNEKGQYIGEITDAASVIDLLNAAIEEDELVLIKTADATVVKAAEDSLGYVGAITFAGANAEEPTTEDPRHSLTGLDVSFNNTDSSLQLTAPDFNPAEGSRLVFTIEQVQAVGPFNEVEGAVNYYTTLSEIQQIVTDPLLEVLATTPKTGNTYSLSGQPVNRILRNIVINSLEDYVHYLVAYLVDSEGVVYEHQTVNMNEVLNSENRNSVPVYRKAMLDGSWLLSIKTAELPVGFDQTIQYTARYISDLVFSQSGEFTKVGDEYQVTYPKGTFVGSRIWIGSYGETDDTPIVTHYTSDIGIVDLPAEVAPPAELNTILIDGPSTVTVNGTAQFVILTSPDDAPIPETLVWSSLHGVSISENGLYVAGAEPVVDTITATVTLASGGTLTADHTLTVTSAE